MSNASGDDTPLTEREIQLTVLAVMDALDANVAFADADSEEFKRIIQKLQRNPASGQEPRLEIIERVIRGGGTLKAAWKEIKRVESASGDDEELTRPQLIPAALQVLVFHCLECDEECKPMRRAEYGLWRNADGAWFALHKWCVEAWSGRRAK